MATRAQPNASELLLSVVIPAHNEEENLAPTVEGITAELHREGISHEIIIVNDNSTDDTQRAAEKLATEHPQTRVVRRTRLGGFGGSAWILPLEE